MEKSQSGPVERVEAYYYKSTGFQPGFTRMKGPRKSIRVDGVARSRAGKY